MTPREIDALTAPSSADFAQGMEVSGASRMLFLSAQTPTDCDWSAPMEFADQARLAWRNLVAQLDAADMTVDNLVKVTIFLADRADLAAHREIFDEALAGRRIAVSTVFCGMVDDAWRIEIEAVAAA